MGDLPDLTTALRSELADLDERVAGLELDHSRMVAAAEASNADDEHDPEGATLAFEREQVASLLTAAQGRRAELLAALDRVGAGTYGTCERCGGPIGADRLEARPSARTCIACARAS